MRMAFAAAYVGIPNAHEIHVVCTNSQWHLAVVLGLLAFATTPRGVAGRIFDIVVVVLGAVSGPYGFFYCLCLLFSGSHDGRGGLRLSSGSWEQVRSCK